MQQRDNRAPLLSALVKTPIAGQSIALFTFAPVAGVQIPIITDASCRFIGPEQAGAGRLVRVTKRDVIVAWGTGGGLTAADGCVLRTMPEFKIGGVPAKVLCAGLAPGFVGLCQFNVEAPQGILSGKVALKIASALVYDFWVR
jgi:uncharacterized protein (TIGR03437 family)